jgi:molybdopterin molybdotransferase
MDGYAVRSGDLGSAGGTLRAVGESRAGSPFEGEIGTGECIAIYTGAELPADCDAVIMVERTRTEGESVHFEVGAGSGQHVCHRGEDLAEGELVLARGKRLTHADLSPLAAVGCDPVPVMRRPRVAVVSTGDELVPPGTRPGPGQIREGNTIHLTALARRAGAEANNLGVVRDEQGALEEAFARALEQHDALVITGGVSMGKYDLVGNALEAIGVEQVFHKIAIKPGKPLWFGKKGRTLVFGLPGNPVSSVVGHEVFVRPALAKLEGTDESEWGRERVRLGRWVGSEPRSIPRQQNIPVHVRQAADGVDELEPVRWKGSGDVVGLSRAVGLAICPADETLAPGSLVPFRPL